MSEFDTKVIDAVVAHMNGDHNEDSLLIARAFGYPEATESEMIGLDSEAGIWRVIDPSGEHEARVAWPAGEITERPEIRREVVALYNAACERLGIARREEHAPSNAQQVERAEHDADRSAGHSAHGSAHASAHGAGGYHHAAPEDDGLFSTSLRTATWGDHGDSEHSGFMEDIMRRRASLADYAALAAQHYFVYEALESAAELFAAAPAYADFHPAELVRLGALEADLAYLIGDDWREQIEPVPATAAYVARIREAADWGWLPGILAHHYTRYLGDLSGGQFIARSLVKQHGFEGNAGVAFYDFTELGSIDGFKTRYRAALDTLGTTLDETEQQRVIDEVRLSYRFNSDTFVDLDKARATA